MTVKEIGQRLKDYDVHLRLREGVQGEYRIERKICHGKPLNPVNFRHWDDYVTAREGYCLILRLQSNQLDQRIFFTLWASDMQRRGGAKVVCDGLDDAYYSRLEKSSAAWGDKVEYQAKERWNSWNTNYPK